MAAVTGACEIIRLLIESGADVSLRDQFGLQAIHFVSSNGHCAAATLLIEAGADVNAQNDVCPVPH
jgi:ankyrin repeat protein